MRPMNIPDPQIIVSQALLLSGRFCRAQKSRRIRRNLLIGDRNHMFS